MKISRIEIRNLKNIAYVELKDLKDLVVLAGPNGAGKSTVLDAINIWKQAIRSYGLRQWLSPRELQRLIRKGTNEASITIEVTYSQLDIEYLNNCNIPITTSAGMPESISLKIDSNGSFSKVGNGVSRQLSYLATYPDRGRFQYAPIFDYYGPNRYLPIKEFTTFNTDALQPIEEQARRIQPSFTIQQKSDTLKDFLYLLNQKELEWFQQKRLESNIVDLTDAPDNFRDIRTLITQLLPHLRFSRVEFGATVQFLFKVVGGPEVDLDELSSGEKEVLSLFLEIYRTNPVNSILMIDEPELHLNQSVESRIVPYIQQNIIMPSNNQVFIVSHSPGVLAGTPNENLYRISYYDQGKNQAQKITSSADRIEALKSLVGDLGVFTTADSFVFLEGTSSSKSFDKKILEILLPELKGKVTFIPTDNCQVVEIISERVQKIVEQDIPFGKFYSIRDRDRLDLHRIHEMESRITKFRVWPRCMLENFLLEKCALQIALSKFGSQYSVEDIQAAIYQAAVNLSDEEVSLRLDDYYQSKIAFKDFREHPQFGTKQKLERAKNIIEQEINQFDTVKQDILDKVSMELSDGSYINTFHGKNLMKQFKKELNISINDEFFFPLLANVMIDNQLVPLDLKDTVIDLLKS